MQPPPSRCLKVVRQFCRISLTPGISDETVRARLSELYDIETSDRLMLLRAEAIEVVVAGDFDRQLEVGQKLVDYGNEFTEFSPVGLYFAAEGSRIQADFEADPTRQRAQREHARALYEQALDKDSSSIRSFRGLARTLEVLGQSAEAAQLFEKVYRRAMADYLDIRNVDPAGSPRTQT